MGVKNGRLELQMDAGNFKWTLGISNGCWEIQMDTGRSKWTMGAPNGRWESNSVQQNPLECIRVH